VITNLPWRNVILNSGGMDSYLLWYLFFKNDEDCLNLFVDLGHKYATKERSAVVALGLRHDTFRVEGVQGPDIGGHEDASGIIPNRNGLLIMQAAMYSEHIHLGVIADEINSDKSADFLSCMQLALNLANRKQYWRTRDSDYQIHTLLRPYTKSDLVHRYLSCGGKPEDLAVTISCYHPTERHCGDCPSCFKRWAALRNNRIEASHTWGSDPRAWAYANGIVDKCHDGTYAHRRRNEILRALGEETLE
jgi:7-cyano-7-deazaguanine synthase